MVYVVKNSWPHLDKYKIMLMDTKVGGHIINCVKVRVKNYDGILCNRRFADVHKNNIILIKNSTVKQYLSFVNGKFASLNTVQTEFVTILIFFIIL